MPRLSRRSFLAGAAALVARPAIGAVEPASGDVDVVVVGAGAAGIAAARRIAASGRSFALIEAADHVGGRCITDMGTFGVPFDRGAHWIHLPSSNPLTRRAPPRGIEIYPAPASQKVRIGLRNAREGELEDFLAAQARATRAINEAARKADGPCEQALPFDLGDWRSTVEFVLGPFPFGTDLAQLSVVDFARATERRSDAFCRQGYGGLLAALGAGVPVQLSTPASTVQIGGNVAVETPKGTITARTAIVTVSANVISSGRLRFAPELPQRVVDAFRRLPLGSYDHIGLLLNGNPLGLDSDDLVFERSADTHTAAILGNVSGSQLCMVEVAGSFGRELSAHGEAAMVDFAADWLGRLYGGEVKRSVERAGATRWNADRWTLGAASAAVPGGEVARGILTEPVNEVVWFAGEAVHQTLWGTVGGAWESGERAAEAVLRRLSNPNEPVAETHEKPEKKPSRKRKSTRTRSRRENLPEVSGGPRQERR